MVRLIARPLLRSAVRSTSFASARSVGGRRFITTNPPHLKSRGWKNSALRWGLAAAGIYYYNTSPVFAEQPQHNLLNPNVDALEDEHSSATLDALTASSRRRNQKDASILQSVVETASEKASAPDNASSIAHPETDVPALGGSPQDLEEEAEGQGAFNPVTGEINWDCPCLGGMAHGPCGPEFREAFSCFVYSTEEPKGMNCIDKFQNMQTCFRAHPDVYKGELEDDEELEAELAQEREHLTDQIAERKASEGEGASSNKPADEAAPASSPKKSSSGSAQKSNKKSTKKQSQTSTTTSDFEERESANEGQRSQLVSSHQTKPIDTPSATGESEVLPKAAFDASDAPVPTPEDKSKSKSKSKNKGE